MEHIITPKVEHVKLLDRFASRNSSVGTLYLTATHLIYVEQTNNTRKELWVLHHHIWSVERLPSAVSGCPLVIYCKTFQRLHLLLPREKEALDVHQSLLRLSQPVKEEELYAFLYNPQQSADERRRGWDLINMAADFSRMGLPNELWEISDLNSSYELCSTYPPLLGLPKSATVATVTGSANFRSRGRLPALSYYYKDTKAAICRCSQPLSGLSSRCIEDEQMLQSVSEANPNCPFIYVVDTRPKLNAMANRAAGKGYENEDNYANIRFHFQGIENIHVMRSSLQKLLELCAQKTVSMSDFLTGLENSGWLRHIKAVMDAGVFLAKAVGDEGASVLVHCSDGWDRTAQVCSIASILLDPYYRTIKGLLVLVEREWIAFGHKFSQRCGHVEGDPKEVSPVFTQFVECVWQLTEQFPCAFQFNEHLLLSVHEHVYSCHYGNFIGNNQREREQLRLRERTFSLWPYLLEHQDEFRNPLYKRSTHNGLLRPNTLPLYFKFWCGMYNRYDRGFHPRQSVLNKLLSLTVRQASEERTMTELQKKLAIADGVLSASDGTVAEATPTSKPSSSSSSFVQPNGGCTSLSECDGGEAAAENNHSEPREDVENKAVSMTTASSKAKAEQTAPPESP